MPFIFDHKSKQIIWFNLNFFHWIPKSLMPLVAKNQKNYVQIIKLKQEQK